MSKRSREGVVLTELGQESHVTQKGIERLLEAVQRDGLPKAYSCRSQYRARKNLAATPTPYGPLIAHWTLHLDSGKHVKVGIQDPMPILYHSMEACAGFRTLMRDAIATHGLARPWSLILYNDGVTPQDSASRHDKRALVNVYWAFLEYGVRALSTEEAWGVLATLRQSTMDAYRGGFRVLHAKFSTAPSSINRGATILKELA